MEVKYIDVTDLLEEQDVELVGKSHYMSRHMYRNSPIETDSDCGNCDGAHCDDCRRVIVPAHFVMRVESDRLVNFLEKKGVPHDIADDMVYNDFYKPYKSGYDLIWSEDEDIKSKNPALWEKLNHRTDKITAFLNKWYSEYSCYTDLYNFLVKETISLVADTDTEVNPESLAKELDGEMRLWFYFDMDENYSIFGKKPEERKPGEKLTRYTSVWQLESGIHNKTDVPNPKRDNWFETHERFVVVSNPTTNEMAFVSIDSYCDGSRSDNIITTPTESVTGNLNYKRIETRNSIYHLWKIGTLYKDENTGSFLIKN